MPKIIPVRYDDLAPGVFGIEFINDKERGIYLAEVHSNNKGPGPTCFYLEGEKTYTIRDGIVEGVETKADCDIYKLDLRGENLSEEMINEETLTKLIESKRDLITVTSLNSGEGYTVPAGVLHLPMTAGILGIFVPSGYKDKIMIEADELNLADFV